MTLVLDSTHKEMLHANSYIYSFMFGLSVFMGETGLVVVDSVSSFKHRKILHSIPEAQPQLFVQNCPSDGLSMHLLKTNPKQHWSSLQSDEPHFSCERTLVKT